MSGACILITFGPVDSSNRKGGVGVLQNGNGVTVAQLSTTFRGGCKVRRGKKSIPKTSSGPQEG